MPSLPHAERPQLTDFLWFALAPPLAGALGMGARRFTTLNLAGILLWTGSGVAAGWILQRQVDQAVAALSALGSLTLSLVAAAVAAYILWLLVRRTLADRSALRLPRLQPQKAAQRIGDGAPVVVYCDCPGA